MFTPGQKVVCIDDSICLCCGCKSALKKNAIYTVMKINDYLLNPFGSQVGVLLQEIIPPHPHFDFGAKRFRPVVKKKTSISIFTDMLKTKELVK